MLWFQIIIFKLDLSKDTLHHNIDEEQTTTQIQCASLPLNPLTARCDLIQNHLLSSAVQKHCFNPIVYSTGMSLYIVSAETPVICSFIW
jgi:hypothetical protein